MAEAIIMRRGGSSTSGWTDKSKIVVTAPAGSQVTLTNGTQAKTVSCDGSVTFGGLDPGTWSVSAYIGGLTLTADDVVIDGDTQQLNYYVTIEKIKVDAVPSQSGTLTYSGAEQSPVWSGYDSDKMTISGATSGINAGSYSATFTLGAAYAWPDGTDSAKAVAWSIGKAAGSVSISPTSLSYEDLSTSETITVTRTGDGAIVARSSDTSIATVSVSGTTVTVKSVADGSATITIYSAASTNYTASSTVTCSVTISSNKIPVFTYSGSYKIVDDDDNVITKSLSDWKICFLTSGTLKFSKLNGAADGIDVFLVGGGGGSSYCGGGGGYTTTAKAVSVALNTSYSITVGAGGATFSAGGTSKAFSKSASGGKGGWRSGSSGAGGAGGSGGGTGYKNGTWDEDGLFWASGAGGSNGGDGGGPHGGAGQGTTTREFGSSSAKLYSGGGGGCTSSATAGEGSSGGSGGGGTGSAGTANTGGGAGGIYGGGYSGGSGIVIIRNKR